MPRDSSILKNEVLSMPYPARHAPRLKLPVDPERIRHMPAQFAPLDRRLVYEGHLHGLTHVQISLYLFLHCVADAAGLSYYSDPRICHFLHLTDSSLHAARQGLVERQLLLYRHPMYQLLDLPPAPASARHASSANAAAGIGPSAGVPPARPSPSPSGEAVVIGDVLRRWLAQGSSV